MTASAEARAAWTAARRRFGEEEARQVLRFWPGAVFGVGLRAGEPALGGVHPSWMDEIEDRVVSPAARLWMERSARADLVDMRAEGEVARVLAMESAAILSAFEQVGRQRLALSMRAAPEGAARALAGRLGGGEVGAAFMAEFERTGGAAREEVRDAVRELARRGGPGDSELLFRAGARHAAPRIVAHGGDSVRQIAQRIPRALGMILIDEAREAVAVGAAPGAARIF